MPWRSEWKSDTEIAVEEALRTCKAGAASEVVAVSIGPTQCNDILRMTVTMGADCVFMSSLVRSARFFHIHHLKANGHPLSSLCDQIPIGSNEDFCGMCSPDWWMLLFRLLKMVIIVSWVLYLVSKLLIMRNSKRKKEEESIHESQALPTMAESLQSYY